MSCRESRIKQGAREAFAERYQLACRKLRTLSGVGLLVAMTFLTELRDLNRFHNRREVAAYLGPCPASYENVEKFDRKGRIVWQGPARLRKVLCQVAWVLEIHCEEFATAYHRIRRNQKHRTKKALVVLMRQPRIKMWHVALASGLSGLGPHEEASGQAQRRGTVTPFSPRHHIYSKVAQG